MAATTSGALKAHLESGGLGLAWFRDRAPKDQALPFGLIQEGVSITPEKHGDTGDPNAHIGLAEQVQVSVYQAWRDGDGKAAEDYALVSRVIRRLHGAQLPAAPSRVYGVIVDGAVRLPGVDAPGGVDPADGANVVHDAITVTVRRDLA